MLVRYSRLRLFKQTFENNRGIGLTSLRSFKLANTKYLLSYAIVSSLAMEFFSRGEGDKQSNLRVG